MKKLATFALLSALSLGNAWADSPIAPLNNVVQIYTGFNSLGYKEVTDFSSSGSFLDSETGVQPLMGLKVSYQLRSEGSWNGLYLQGKYAITNGTTYYKGAISDGFTSTPYEKDGTISKTKDWSIRVGQAFGLADGSQLIPFGELGHHYWLRDLGAAPGYREDYSHNMYALGLKWQTIAKPGWLVDVEGTIGQTFSAKMSADIIDDAPFQLAPRSQISLGLGVTQFLSPKLRVSYGLEYVRFQYGRSNVIQGMLEPDSTSNIFQGSVGLGLAF